MRQTQSLLVFLILVLAWACDTANNVEPVFKRTYIKYYGTDGDQYAADLQVNADGTMLILGNSVSLSGQRSAFVIKTDDEGNVIWERKIGETDQIAVDVEPILFGSHSGNYIVALNHEKGDTTRIKLLRIDQSGQLIDSAVLPLHNHGGFRQVARSVTALPDADQYIVVGMADRGLIRESSPINQFNDQSDILAFRLNNALAIEDTVVTKGGEQDGCAIRAFQLEGVNAGKLALFSYTDRPFKSDQFGYNFSFDILNEGVPVGRLVGSDTEEEFLASVTKASPMNGSGFLMAGTARSTAGGTGDLYLVKYDDEFQQRAVDTRLALNRNLECVSSDNASEGYYVLSNERVEGLFRDITLVKVNRRGDYEWSKSFGSRDGDDTATSVASLADGRIAVVGTMQLQTKRKVALIVLKNNGSF